MEQMGAISEGVWRSLSGMCTSEEADFMAQLLDTSTNFWSNHESTMSSGRVDEVYFSASTNNMYNFIRGSTTISGSNSPYQLLMNNSSSMSTDFCIDNAATNTSSYFIEYNDCMNQEMSSGNAEEADGILSGPAAPDEYRQVEKESQLPPKAPSDGTSSKPFKNSKKRSRNTGDASEDQKNKRNVRSKNKKNQSNPKNDEETSGGVNGAASSSCCSEDESNDFHEFSEGPSSPSLSSKGTGALNLNGKARASRGAATDPQSLYARKRRERINERLRILQTLVPNGTKVDISTMLEEAVQYVKFLQLQIKMLSSDDLWMYAPIAYNGMDIGLDLKLNTSPR